jgi:hypothetical protein
MVQLLEGEHRIPCGSPVTQDQTLSFKRHIAVHAEEMWKVRRRQPNYHYHNSNTEISMTTLYLIAILQCYLRGGGLDQVAGASPCSLRHVGQGCFGLYIILCIHGLSVFEQCFKGGCW